MSKIIFLTGTTGQDASFLSEQLLEKGCKVYGLVRRQSTDNLWRIKHLLTNKDFELVTGDMIDGSSLNKLIASIKPDWIFNLAAQSFVSASWASPESTMEINAMGFLKLLEACRLYGKSDVRIYQASSSEQFGRAKETPQKETTPFYPRSIYGVSKVAAHWIGINYRESYNMFISMGICFNHESERRGLEFLSRKVTDGVARIAYKLTDHITLGNLEAERDYGYSPEFTEAMIKILELDEPGEFVLSTGETHSIREFVREAFKNIGIYDYKKYIKEDPKFMRPTEVNSLLGNSYRAKAMIGWNPSVKFKELVSMMVKKDLERYEKQQK